MLGARQVSVIGVQGSGVFRDKSGVSWVRRVKECVTKALSTRRVCYLINITGSTGHS